MASTITRPPVGMLLAYGGPRIAEMPGVQWTDIELDAARVLVLRHASPLVTMGDCAHRV